MNWREYFSYLAVEVNQSNFLMARIVFKILAFTLINCSCQTDTYHKTNFAVKDSFLKKYISIVDTLSYYDTSTLEFKLLRAYSSNDTNTLKKLVRHFENLNTKPGWQINMDSCVKQQPFKNINAEEKYLFNYSSAFCPYVTTSIIIKYKD